MGGGPRVCVTWLTNACQAGRDGARRGARYAPGDMCMNIATPRGAGFRRLRFWRFSRLSRWPPRRHARRHGERDGPARRCAQAPRGVAGGLSPAAPRHPAHRHGRARVEPAPRGARCLGRAAPALGRASGGHGLDAGRHGRPARAGRGAGATVPRDIADWCPGYEAAGRDSGGRSGRGWSRRWPGTRARIARRPWAAAGAGSGWCRSRRRRRATGAAPRPRGRRCWTGRRTCAAACRIMGATVPRDGVVSRGMRGVAADWGPFHSSRKREDMRQWLRAQDYCRARDPRHCAVRSCDRSGG
jgi:hypothetical protein